MANITAKEEKFIQAIIFGECEKFENISNVMKAPDCVFPSYLQNFRDFELLNPDLMEKASDCATLINNPCNYKIENNIITSWLDFFEYVFNKIAKSISSGEYMVVLNQLPMSWYKDSHVLEVIAKVFRNRGFIVSINTFEEKYSDGSYTFQTWDGYAKMKIHWNSFNDKIVNPKSEEDII